MSWVATWSRAGRRVAAYLMRGALFLLILQAVSAEDLWESALEHKNDHRISVMFDQQDENAYSQTNIISAIQWCRTNGVTKVYLETFRTGSPVPQTQLKFARDSFRAEGFEVAGAVTTTRFGMGATQQLTGCYTSFNSQNQLSNIFTSAARLFDRIIIDDFLFTTCSCSECVHSLFNQEFNVGIRSFPCPGSDWSGFRRQLMLKVSNHLILQTAQWANPDVQITLKFPKWYDHYQLRGYDVVKQSELYPQVWVGTETRDPCASNEWGQTPQYGAYFVMRWVLKVSGSKLGGGWFDWLATSPPTYLEQARQTVLGGGRESVLFCYGGLQSTNSDNPCVSPPFSDATANVALLRANLPELWTVAPKIRARIPLGIAAYKPINSGPTVTNETEVFSWVGMLGLPLDPCYEFPTNAPAAFFSTHALTDINFTRNFAAFVRAGKPVLITDNLAQQLRAQFAYDLPALKATNVTTLTLGTNGVNAASLLNLEQAELDALRAPLLQALKLCLKAPAGVAIYPFTDSSYVIENFNDAVANVTLNQQDLSVPERGWITHFTESAALP
jgi:hypothetical protein